MRQVLFACALSIASSAFASLPPGAPIEDATDKRVAARIQVLDAFFGFIHNWLEDISSSNPPYKLGMPRAIHSSLELDGATCAAYRSIFVKINFQARQDLLSAAGQDHDGIGFAANMSAYGANAFFDLCGSSSRSGRDAQSAFCRRELARPDPFANAAYQPLLATPGLSEGSKQYLLAFDQAVKAESSANCLR